MSKLKKTLTMDESDLQKDSKDFSFLTDLQDPKMLTSEMDILRKAYELVLENSDLFFKELAKAFSNEWDNGEINALI